MKLQESSALKYFFVSVLLMAVTLFIYGYFKEKKVEPEAFSPIGNIYSWQGEVYFKNLENKKWNRPLAHQKFGNEVQTYKTLGASEIYFLLNNGIGKIEAGENTSLSILRSEEEKSSCILRLEFGELFVQMNGITRQQCYLRAESGDFIIRNADVTFIKKPSGVLNFVVHRGYIRYKGDISSVRIESAHWGYLNKKKVNSFPFTFKPTTPLEHDRVFHKGNNKTLTRFAWNGVEWAESVELLLGEDKENLKTVYVHRKKAEKEFSYTLPYGIFYWRLVAKKGRRDSKTPIYKIFSIQEAAPQLQSPVSLAKVLKNSSEPIRFSWFNPSRLERQVLEISQSSDFENLTVRQPVKNNYFTVESFDKPGVYYWRVSGFRHQSSEILFSQVQSFEVIPIKQVFNKVEFYDQPDEVISQNSLKYSDVKINWNIPYGLNYWVLQIYNYQKRVIFQKRMRSNFNQVIFPNELSVGGYYWSIIAFNGEAIKQTDLIPFKVERARKLRWGNSSGKSISWTSGPKSTKYYRVYIQPISAQANSKRSAIKVVKRQFLMRDLSPGLYGFKVKAYDLKGRLLAETTQEYFQAQ